MFRGPRRSTECNDSSRPGGLPSLMLVRATQLMPVTHEDMLAVGRQRYSVRLSQG